MVSEATKQRPLAELFLIKQCFPSYLQGHPERVLKVNHVAGVFIFTKNQFSQLFLQEK